MEKMAAAPTDDPRQHCQKAIDLLKTARGQVNATLRMMEEDRNCVDISRQVHASITLMRKANLVLLKQQLSACVMERTPARAEKLAAILERYLDLSRLQEE